MVVPSSNPGTKETEAGGSLVPDQPRLESISNKLIEKLGFVCF